MKILADALTVASLQEARAHIQPLGFTSMSKSPKLSVFHFFHLYNEDDNSTYLMQVLT